MVQVWESLQVGDRGRWASSVGQNLACPELMRVEVWWDGTLQECSELDIRESRKARTPRPSGSWGHVAKGGSKEPWLVAELRSYEFRGCGVAGSGSCGVVERTAPLMSKSDNCSGLAHTDGFLEAVDMNSFVLSTPM